MLRIALLLLLLLGFSRPSQGLYYIDDTSSSVSYTGSTWAHYNQSFNIPAAFPNGTTSGVVGDFCHEHTLSRVQCYSSDKCSFTIAFQGSGITVFVVQGYDAINASIQMDGDLLNPVILDYPADITYNVSLYNNQSLPFAQHVLNIQLESWDGSNGLPSSVLFDYAVINETVPSANSGSRLGGAVIAAIALGATVLVGLIAAFTIYFFRSCRTALQRDDKYNLSSDTVDDVSKAPHETGDILAEVPYVDMKGSNNMPQQAENINSSREPKVPLVSAAFGHVVQMYL